MERRFARWSVILCGAAISLAGAWGAVAQTPAGEGDGEQGEPGAPEVLRNPASEKSTKQPSAKDPEQDTSKLLGAPSPEDAVPEKEDRYKGANDAAEARRRKALPPPKPPTGARRLRYKLERPISYGFRGEHRAAVRDREDLKQVYRAAHTVTYTPVGPDEELPPPAWTLDPAEQAQRAGALEDDEVRVLMEVEKSFGEFERPDLLGQTERTHQIMRQARISYRMREDGRIRDVRIHAPTHPLARNSIEQFARLASLMQPALPVRPVGPGDTWTQKITYRDGKGLAQFSQDSVNSYTFERWQTCGDTVCARIAVSQEMKSAGRMSFKARETRGASVGKGSGYILFDYRRGEVFMSNWELRGQGNVTAMERDEDAAANQDGDGDGEPVKELASAEVLVELEASSERMTPQGGLPPLPPRARSAQSRPPRAPRSDRTTPSSMELHLARRPDKQGRGPLWFPPADLRGPL